MTAQQPARGLGRPMEAPAQTPYPLSCLDHNPLGLNVTFLLSFPTARPEQGRDAVAAGIRQLVKMHPFLAGDVTRRSAGGGRRNPWQLEPDAAASLLRQPMLRTRDFSDDESVADTPPAGGLMTGPEEQRAMGRLCPLPLDADPSLPRRPVLRFQANVFRDGLVLAMTFHHSVLDAGGAGRVLGLLADCCRDPAAAAARTSRVADRQLRGQIAPRGPSPSTGTRAPAVFRQHYCGLGDWSRLLADDWCGFLEARATELVTWRVTLPGHRIQHLDEACNALLRRRRARARAGEAGAGPGPDFVTKNDVVSALLALVLQRTGRPGSPKTEMSIAVDVRGRFRPPAFGDYLGNMLVPVYAGVPARGPDRDAAGPGGGGAGPSGGAGPGGDAASGEREREREREPERERRQPLLHADHCEAITLLAARIRRGILAVDADYLDQAVAHLHAQPDWADIGFRGVPIPLSSFRNLDLFGLDFGQGLGPRPAAFQLHIPVLGGMCFILPKRPAEEGPTPWDLHLTLSREEQAMVAGDGLFRWATGGG